MEGRGRLISEFKASLVYRMSSRITKPIHKNPVSKTEKKERKEEETWGGRERDRRRQGGSEGGKGEEREN